MKKIVASIILKCGICGHCAEQGPEDFPVSDNRPIITTAMLAKEIVSKRSVIMHHCNLDRTYGEYQYAGIKVYNQLED